MVQRSEADFMNSAVIGNKRYPFRHPTVGDSFSVGFVKHSFKAKALEEIKKLAPDATEEEIETVFQEGEATTNVICMLCVCANIPIDVIERASTDELVTAVSAFNQFLGKNG